MRLLVEEVMHKNMYKLKETDPIYRAVDLIEQKRIRHIPIIDNSERVIGIVSDRDIRASLPSIFSPDNKWDALTKQVRSIMTKDIITVHPFDFVEEISALFYQHQIGCLPVVHNDQFVGLITETDVLKTFVELTGVHLPGSQFKIRTPNSSETLSDILQVINQFQTLIHSVLVYPDKKNNNKNIIVIRLSTIHPIPIVRSLKEHHFEVLSPSVPEN